MHTNIHLNIDGIDINRSSLVIYYSGTVMPARARRILYLLVCWRYQQ